MILIDANNMFYAAYYAAGRNSIATKNIFLSMVSKAVGGMSYSPIVSRTRLVWDGYNSWRFNAYPDYKKGRSASAFEDDEQKKEFYRIKDMAIKHINKETNIKQIGIREFEADDVISYYVHKRMKRNENEAIVIVSNDSDFYQLLKKNVVIRKVGKKSDEMSYGRYWFVNKYGILPELWSCFKALSGDSSDNIPGVKGIGEVRALNILKEYGHIHKWLFKKNIVYGDRWINMVINERDNVKLYYSVVDLTRYAKVKINENMFKHNTGE